MGLWTRQCAGQDVTGLVHHSVRGLVAAYSSEAAVAYHLRLGYHSTPLLFAAIGLLLAVGLGWHRRQYRALGQWPAWVRT